jgi:hypothetical protein
VSSHLALPHKGHLDAVFHVFGYLDQHHNPEMVFETSDPTIKKHLFNRKDLSTSESGLTIHGEMPYNMPKARGFGFTIQAFVDVDHATESITRCSRTSQFLCVLEWCSYLLDI